MEKGLYFEITDIMLKLGLQPKFAGFEYLREAVGLYVNKATSEEKLTTEIYPKIAEKYDVSVMIVERSIRMAISDSFNSKGLLGLNDYYQNVVYSGDFMLSNGELISIIAEILKLNKIRDKLASGNKIVG